MNELDGFRTSVFNLELDKHVGKSHDAETDLSQVVCKFSLFLDWVEIFIFVQNAV